ncbi:hypothetical protein [Arthrobacter sp. Soil763]|uniref:hypothetical protein n=1 Tax=Arthrobacter sp. Soil763 TaxID=1736402 RepID=UPI0012F7EC72|nr:hypothetical protein [Arthrobacter sp. Soil763]
MGVHESSDEVAPALLGRIYDGGQLLGIGNGQPRRNDVPLTFAALWHVPSQDRSYLSKNT